MSRTKGTIITGAPYEVNAAAPLDAKSNVGLKSDLFTAATWQAPSSSGANAGKMFCYYGMLVYVGNDTEANNGLYVLKNSGANDANVDALVENNWERISQSDSKIAAIKTNADKVDTKLDKDFVTNSTQGSLGEGTTFAARSDNTADATNVYITGKQIKDFAASAVSDKGTYADEAALKAAYPNPEDGWSATVLSTGTTWISKDGAWTDSGKSNGVTSVNGKSGKVTLVAADIDDVLSDTETDEHIQVAFTADREDLNTTAKSVVGGINEVRAAVTKNAGDITANTTAIANKQDKTINLEIQGAQAATVTDALSSLDTVLTSVKSTADDAAKKDASNIEAATWKTVLGYQSADEVATAVNNGITTNEYSTLATTAKTVKGAIEELKTAVDGKASSGDLTSVKGDVDALKTTVGDADSGLVKDVATNTAAINSANTEIAKKQNQAISIEGIEAKTVEGALTEIKNATTTNATALTGKVAKSDIVTTIAASTSASDTKVPSEKAVASAVEAVKSVASKAYKYKGSDTYANISAIQDAEVGDVWNSTTANGVYPKGTNYAWNGEEWDALGGEVDLSAYQTKAITVGEEETTVEAAINAVKTTADAAAKADASNITVATWKTKLGFITADDQVQPDWKATSGKAEILNKPYIDTVSGVPGIELTTTTVSGDKIVLKTADSYNGTDSIEATTYGNINIISNGYSSFGSSVTIKADSPGTGGTINLIAPEGIKGGYDSYRGTIKLSTGTGEIKLEGETATVNSLAINKATLIDGDNTIALATAGKIICKSGINVTEFVVNGESVVKEILSGSDIFSISAYADGSYTLASTAAGNAIIMNI